MELRLERRSQVDKTPAIKISENSTALLTPAISSDYWAYRVRLNDRQAVIGFPKFGTIGIGFAVEEDWNTNLPYTCHTIEIVSHIWHNVMSGDPEYRDDDESYDPERGISIAQVYAAVEAIQRAATVDRPDEPGMNSQSSYESLVVTE